MTVASPIRVGRYVLFGEIAAGGMAAVHFGRVRGDASFARIVAIKRLHPHLAKESELANMFVDEARIAARIQHPNVASILDVVALPEGELLIVMEYVAGESLSRLLRRLRSDGETAPADVTCAVICDALGGLHAAHQAKDDMGQVLGIIHRDVSPQNLLVGADGITRLVDFGVAKARGRIQATRANQVKGKIAYMAPEQLRGAAIDRRADIYAMGVVMWEALAGERLFEADSEGETVTKILDRVIPAPSTVRSAVPKALDGVVLKALARDPSGRFGTARDMAAAIESAMTPASARGVADFVQMVAGDVLAERQRAVAELERRTENDDSTVGALITNPVRARRLRATWIVAAVMLGLAATTAAAVSGRLRTRPVASGVSTEVVAPVLSSPVVTSANVPEPPTPVVTATANVATSATESAVVHHVTPHITHTAAGPRSNAPCPVKKYFEDGIWVYRRPERDESGACP